MTDNNEQDKPVDKKRPPARSWEVQAYMVRYPARRFVPPADVIEREDKIIVLVEIAGMRGDSFKIALYQQRLVISGTRERPDFADAAYHQAEIGFGEFVLDILMPWTIAQDKVTASYSNGFLRVELPREGAKRVHIVDVNDEDDES